jgi:hypothetical protein
MKETTAKEGGTSFGRGANPNLAVSHLIIHKKLQYTSNLIVPVFSTFGMICMSKSFCSEWWYPMTFLFNSPSCTQDLYFLYSFIVFKTRPTTLFVRDIRIVVDDDL